MKPELLCGFLLIGVSLLQPRAVAQTSEFGGHLKLDALLQALPQESTASDWFGSEQSQLIASSRLNFSHRRNEWDFKADYQIYFQQGDLSGNQISASSFSNYSLDDQTRWFDLTDLSSQGSRHQIAQRLDRFSLGYRGQRWTLSAGRQALSWGSGVFFHPLDIVNPFNPTAVDKEYKAGDDMLYTQYLFDSGNDIELVHVVRREPETGAIKSDQASSVVKYHLYFADQEADFLLAQHYGDSLLGLGYTRSLGGALWRSDLLISRSDDNNSAQLVTNLSYAWQWWQKNISGSIEYFHNGFGVDADCDSACISRNSELSDRLERGDLFTLGRQYIAVSAAVELNPLLVATPNLLVNLEDNSSYLQVSFNYNLSDNLRLTGVLSQPIGPSNTEFGGLVSESENLNLATGFQVSGQAAWYF